MGGNTSKLLSIDRQLWCTGCHQKFDHPVKLQCGHKFCGPESGKNCAEKVLNRGRCIVSNCDFEIQPEIGDANFQKLEERELSEYEIAFPIPNKEVEESAAISEETGQTPKSGQSVPAAGIRGFELVDDLKKNGRKKLLIIGKTGVGKSTLCNVIAGLDPDSNAFPASSSAVSCTQTTQFGNIRFNGCREDLISLIDTIGFSDPEDDEDVKVISDLVLRLKSNCDYVNLFAIVVHGQQPRLDGSLVGMIRIFEEMFGDQFWKQVVVIFSGLRMDSESQAHRVKTNKSTDDEKSKNYLETLEEKFPRSGGIRYLHLDAWHQDKDDVEKKSFEDSMKSLRNMLYDAPKMETADVQQVETKHAKLKRTISQQRKLLEDMRKLIQQNQAERDKLTQMKKDFDDYKQQQERKLTKMMKEQEEMEQRHQEQITQMMSNLTTIYARKESELRRQIQELNNQRQHDQNQLKEIMERQLAENQKQFDDELKKLQAQHQSVLKKLKQQGSNDRNLVQQLKILDDKEKKLREKHEIDKKKLEEGYKAKSEELGKEKQKLSNQYSQQLDQLQEDQKNEKAQKENELRIKQLKEVIKKAEANGVTDPMTAPAKTDGEGWRKLAYDTFMTNSGNYIAKCHATVTILENQYPDNHWGVFAAIQENSDSDDILSMINNGESEAVDRGWEDKQIWKDIPGKDSNGKNTLCTLYIWKAPKSHYKEFGKPEDEEKANINQIIEVLKDKQKREKLQTDGKKWSCDKWRDELIKQMDNCQLLQREKHLVVGKLLYRYSQYHSCFSTSVGVFVYISFTT